MGSIFQVLIVIGIIVFAIAKQVRESAEKKQKQTKASTPNPNRPEGMTGKSEKPQRAPFLSHDYEKDLYPSLSANAPRTTSSIGTKSPKESIEASSIEESLDTGPEFNIHSTEEVRRGIIWSEILKRKY